MRTNLTHFVAAIMRGKFSILAAAIVLLPAIGWSQEYTVTDLGTLGGTYSLATAVNNKGQVAGQSTTPTQIQANGQADAFLYSKGKMTDLGNFGGDSGSNTTYFFTANSANGVTGNIANAVNDDGVVAGMAFDADGNPHPFLWSAGTMQDLAPGQVGAAFGINANEVAVGAIGSGYSLDGSSDFNGYGAIFNGVGSFAGVPIPASLLVSSPVAINNTGQMAGSCTADVYTTVFACLSIGTTVQELQPLNGYWASFANAINDSGNTCGESYSSVGPTATAWIGGSALNLGMPPNTYDSKCDGMDDFGQYVGNVNSGASNQIGVLWDPVHGARDLNKLIPKFFHKGHAFVITNAVSLSNAGFIAAQCLYENGNNHACLLTPNPVLILRDNIVAFAQGDPECIQCMNILVPEAHRLPESLEGLTGDRREAVITTVDKIGVEVEKLERERKISQPKALLLIHEAQQVLSALEPRE
jgi:probable HAF family extracellular repeat protein